MKQDLFRRVTALFCIVLLFFSSAGMSLLWANPTGAAPITGTVNFSSAGNTLTVNQLSTNAIINWNDFSINAGETTNFNLPDASGATLNRVTGAVASTIAGNLNSNGRLFLINPNGVIVSNSGIINTAGFLASTRDMTDADFLDGGAYTLDGNGSAGIDVRFGSSISASSGDIILVGQRITNSGNLSAPNGVAGLAAGRQIVYTPGGNEVLRVVSGITEGGLGVNQTGVINAAQAELKAAGGNVYALAVSARGTVAAQGTTTRNGRILLTANNGNVEVGGNLSARDSDNSGGQISTVGSGNTRPAETIVATEGSLSTGGGSRSSISLSSLNHTRVFGTLNTPGGTVNLSAGGALDYRGATTAATINASVRADTTIGDVADLGPGDEVLFGDPITSQIDVDTLRLSSATNIFVSSFGDLTVRDRLSTFDPINFNLSADRDLTFNDQVSSAGNLDLRAGRAITINDGLNTDGTGSDIFLRSGSTTTIGAQGLITTAEGNIIISTSGGFINNRSLGSHLALQAGQFGDGRWIIYAPTPASVKLGGLTPTVEAYSTAPIQTPGALPVSLADGPNALIFASSDPRFVSADVAGGFTGDGEESLNPILELPVDTSLISRPPSSSTSPTAHPGTLNPAGETVAQRDARLKAEAIILQLVGLPTPGNAGADFFPIVFNALAALLGPNATQADMALFLASLATNEEARFLLAGQLTATTMGLIKSTNRTPTEVAFLNHIASKMGGLQLEMAEKTIAEYEQYKVDRFESHLNSFSVLLDPIGKGYEAGTIVGILSDGNQAQLSAGERWGVSISAGFVGGLPFAISGATSVVAAANGVALGNAAMAAQSVVTGAASAATGGASSAAAGGAIATKITAGAVAGPVVIIVVAIMAIVMQSIEVGKIVELEKAMKEALVSAREGFDFNDYLGSETEEAFLQEMLNYQFGISPALFAEGLSGTSDITTLPNGNLLINGLEVITNRP